MAKSRTDPPLAALQGWMQTVITHPEGVEGSHATPQVSKQVAGVVIEDLVAPSPTLSATERLAIYSHGYRARLLECFRAQFPCLLHACGDELFAHFVDDYLSHHPSSSPSLNDLAANFPSHLISTRPDADRPPEDRESWPDFLIDLATLERSFQEVFDGPGIERQTLPNPAEIAQRPPEALGQTRFEPAPCLRLLVTRYPVHGYFTAVRRGAAPPLPDPGQTHLAIHRRDFTVAIVPLLRSDYEVLADLIQGVTVQQANQGRMLVGEVRSCLATWIEKGFFSSLL